MKKILIVDDEASVREMIEEMLIRENYELISVENGVQATQELSKSAIDIVITDIVMDKENGIDLIMDMKKKYAEIPVVAISGGGGIEGRFNYLEIAKLVGADRILKKPFTADVLRKTLRELFAECEAQDK